MNKKELSLRELQMLQLSAMKDIHNMCERLSINYYIIGGTLLGAVRHGGFIPWDDDIDIAMMRPDYERFVQLFNANMNTSKYFLQNFDTDKDFRPALSRVCILGTFLDFKCESHWRYCKCTYVDIFPIDNVPDNEELRLRQDKKLQRQRQLIRRKLYRIHEENSSVVILIKKIVAACLKLYPLSKAQSNVVKTMTLYDGTVTKNVCSMASHYSYDKQNMPRSIYGTPTLIKFEDTSLYGPERVSDYLQKIFGKNYMELPPVEKRDTPTSVYLTV